MSGKCGETLDTIKQKMKRTEREISKPQDFTDPQELFNRLMTTVKEYHPSTDLSMIEDAYKLAEKAHKGQMRKSGEPYIIHPLCVAIILAELELDKETIVAGILHDVVEDTKYTLDDVASMFNDEVAELVNGVTKLGQMNYSQDKMDVQAENLRKMFLSMARDIRVILIKLADRLHNMRTLQYMSEEKQKEKSRETMDIYAPIAHRLGISKIKVELDDLSLAYLEPEVYKDLSQQLEEKKANRERFIQSIIEEVGYHLSEAGIQAEIGGRVKHLFSIYKKMRNQNKNMDQIYDIFAVRVKVESVKDCYAVLGVIHEMFTPIPGRFKDYIAMPKENMYQSLHTTLIGSSGLPFEIQIRTYEMHRIAEYGIAAHWKYKEGGGNINKEEEKLSWLRQILEWQQDVADNKEFLSVLKTDLDLFAEKVYCFTPQGDVKALPAGSTPIDFAYLIHTAVGNRMVGARVNGRQVPITYQLQSGDRVSIITSQNSAGPSRDWLNIVKSPQARTKINQWFKSQFKEENIQKGKDLIDKYCKSKGLEFSDYAKPEYQKKVMKKYGLKNWDAVLAAVGHGGLKEGQVVNKLKEEYDKDHKANMTDEETLEKIRESAAKPQTRTRSKSGITVKGIHDVSVRFSKCCSPVPGDEIIGFITRGRGISIHRTDCTNIVNMPDHDRTRLIDAEWEDADVIGPDELYLTEICLYANNRTGILLDISKSFMELKIDIKSLQTRVNKNNLASILISFEIRSIQELNHIIGKLKNIESVIAVERTAG